MADDTGLPELLWGLENEATGVIAEDFVGLVQGWVEGQGRLPLADLQALVNFCAEQAGYWGCEWLFSPAADPDTDAEQEMQSWDQEWERWTQRLLEADPSLDETLRSAKNHIFFKHVQQRRVELNQSRFFQQMVSNLLPKLSVRLKKMGFKNQAAACYLVAFYPKGTVGRP